jgi:indolepyruvate ferredoxin oxidoreductase
MGGSCRACVEEDLRTKRERLIAPGAPAEAEGALDAREIAHTLVGDDAQANIVLLGAAFQLGLIPLPADAIEQALRLNGAAVERNLAAFARRCRAAAAGRRATTTSRGRWSLPPHGYARSPCRLG